MASQPAPRRFRISVARALQELQEAVDMLVLEYPHITLWPPSVTAAIMCPGSFNPTNDYVSQAVSTNLA